MSEDDPLEHGMAVTMTGMAAGSRAAEALLRAAQDAKARRAAALRADAQEADRRSEALERSRQVAEAADYRERADQARSIYADLASEASLKEATVDEIVTRVHGVHAWAELDDSFDGEAEQMRENLRALYGVDLGEAWTEQKNAEYLADLARQGLDEAEHDSAEVGADLEAGYDAPEARAAREQATVQRAGGEGKEDVRARTTADKLNAHSPRRTAAMTAGRTTAKSRPARRTAARTGQQRGR